MKVELFALLLLISCSTVQDRVPASLDDDYVFGEVVSARSSVRVFPPRINNEILDFYFYLELRNAQGELIDCEPEKIVLLDDQNVTQDFSFQRISRGKYYVLVKDIEDSEPRTLNFVINGQAIGKQYHLLFTKVDKQTSWVKEVERVGNNLKLNLYLGDKNGMPVQVSSPPEFIFEGRTSLASLKNLGEGLWEFEIRLPEENDIIYISVHTHGSYLERMFRLQHIAN